MGWTTTFKPKGMKHSDFFKQEFEQEYIPFEKTGFTIIYDTASFTDYFAIISRTDKDTGETKNFVLTVLVRNYPFLSDYNISYKEVEESCGPCVVPPLSFFKVMEELVPEPEGKYGEEWRERCKQKYDKLKRLICGLSNRYQKRIQRK